jgi:poly(3-hydroxybutyrate) depolymerase
MTFSKEWQGDPDAKTDDVKFTLDLIDHISSKYCVDTDKIYASGKSNGGGFSANILACDPVASNKIAAFAGIAGAYYQGTTSAGCDAKTVPIKCSPGRKPIPILETHGTADGVIPYNGGWSKSMRNKGFTLLTCPT